jgi:hypothetical protein
MINRELRPLGSTGSWPHLRRVTAERIDLITFQYFSSGGNFVVEVAVGAPGGFTTSWEKVMEPKRLTAHNITRPRPRLQPDRSFGPGATLPVSLSGSDWFVFGPRNYEPGGEVVHSAEHYDAVAASVPIAIRTQADPFWANTPPSR